MSILLLMEHDGGQLRQASLRAVSFAADLARLQGTAYDLLVCGQETVAVVEHARTLGARAVLAADHPCLAQPLADRYAAVLERLVGERGYDGVVAASSTFSKDILPRAAALVGAGMLTDVVAVEAANGGLRFQRPVYAGNALASVTLAGPRRFFTCRATAFPAAAPTATQSPVEPVLVDPGLLPEGTEFVSRAERPAGRPDLTEARVVVSGGRPLKDRETFLQLVGSLADAFGGAIGATRAAVDAGIAPNDWQVGQTGKVVAPELYVACGVSGAIQHLAGMKDSKVIVAINRDAEAPIFQLATYGLVADLYEALPQLAAAVRALKRDDGG